MNEFENIYRTYFRDVYLYLKSISQSDDIAEEITAVTFFKAMKSLDSFQGTCDIRVWLCQIAKNCYISYLRKNKKITDADSLEEQSDDFDLLQYLCNKEESMEIVRIVHTLSEPYKEVFMLRVFGEMSFKKIGQLFYKNENWACVTYHRARSKIREKMEETS